MEAFGGLLRSTVECPACPTQRAACEEFLSLEVELEGEDNVDGDGRRSARIRGTRTTTPMIRCRPGP